MNLAYQVQQLGHGAEVRALFFDGPKLTGSQFIAYYSDWADANDLAAYLLEKAIADHNAEMERQRRQTWAGWFRELLRAA